MLKELDFSANRARSWKLGGKRSWIFPTSEKAGSQIFDSARARTFPQCFISKSKKAKLKLEIKSKWQITLPSSDKVEVKNTGKLFGN